MVQSTISKTGEQVITLTLFTLLISPS